MSPLEDEKRRLDDVITDSLDELDEPFDEDERAVQILKQCASLYRGKLRAAADSVSVEALKEISELYRVPPPLIMHAVEHGPKNAHSSYRAKEEKG